MAVLFPGTSGNGLIRTSSANPTTAALTVCAFIRPVNNAFPKTIWAWRNANRDEDYKFQIGASGLSVFHNGAERAVTALPNSGTDYFVAMVLNGAAINCYVGQTNTNSALSVSGTGVRTAGTGNPDEMYVGQSWSANDFWNGHIQSLRIFQAALGASGDLASEQKRQIPRDWGDLWAWYRMLSANTNEANWDRSGNGRDLSEIGTGAGRTDGLSLGQGYNPRFPKAWTRTSAPMSWTIIQDSIIASTAVVPSPTVSLVIQPSAIASGSTVRAPTLTLVVQPSLIASSSAVHAPTVALVVQPSLIVSTAVVRTPTVTLELLAPTIASTATVRAPALTLTVQPPLISSGSTVRAPTLTLAVQPALISGAATVASPTLALVVRPPSIASTSTVHEPVVEDRTTVHANIAAAPLVREPVLELQLLLERIASTAVVFGPAVALIPRLEAGSTTTATLERSSAAILDSSQTAGAPQGAASATIDSSSTTAEISNG